MTPEQIAAAIVNAPLSITPDQRDYLANQIATALRTARNEALEEAALVAAKYTVYREIQCLIATDIRALKHKDGQP